MLAAKAKFCHFMSQLVFATTARINNDDLTRWARMALNKFGQDIDVLVFIK